MLLQETNLHLGFLAEEDAQAADVGAADVDEVDDAAEKFGFQKVMVFFYLDRSPQILKKLENIQGRKNQWEVFKI